MEDGEITLATVRCAKNCTCNDIMSMDNQHPAITLNTELVHAAHPIKSRAWASSVLRVTGQRRGGRVPVLKNENSVHIATARPYIPSLPKDSSRLRVEKAIMKPWEFQANVFVAVNLLTCSQTAQEQFHNLSVSQPQR